ncbi:hypothetical protein BUALT_Bualt06G0101700 [Buddleja alternifolia]|uniref:Uncharacterized protein n=1 Tax=Buddleja alternifolia TaxID=168488 RepID=A0AAV6XFQ7_9LAMI|nr:hypothetical protein BUALT_Bualt06G0101700 [Buddleja alternifolia]
MSAAASSLKPNTTTTTCQLPRAPPTPLFKEPPPLSSDPTFTRPANSSANPMPHPPTVTPLLHHQNPPLAIASLTQIATTPTSNNTTAASTQATVPPPILAVPPVTIASHSPPATTTAPPAVAEKAVHPQWSSPTVSSGSNSSSHSTHHSTPQRSRLGMGKSVLPSSSKLGGYTTFKSKIQQKRMGIVSLNHGRATFTSPGPTVQPKKRKHHDMKEPLRDTTSSTPENSNMPSFSRHFENWLNRIESKLDRILAHFHIPPD